jgi:hypothetical protein
MHRFLSLLASLGLLALPAAAQIGLQRQCWTIPRTEGGTDAVAGMAWYPPPSPTRPSRSARCSARSR